MPGDWNAVWQAGVGTLAVGAVGGMVKLFFSQAATAAQTAKNARDIEAHQRECNERHEDSAKMTVKIDRLERSVDTLQTAVWKVIDVSARIETKVEIIMESK